MENYDSEFIVIDKRRNIPILVDIRIIDSDKTGWKEIAIGCYLASLDLTASECTDNDIDKIKKRFPDISRKDIITALDILSSISEEDF